jgi:hypothetical protein
MAADASGSQEPLRKMRFGRLRRRQADSGAWKVDPEPENNPFSVHVGAAYSRWLEANRPYALSSSPGTPAPMWLACRLALRAHEKAHADQQASALAIVNLMKVNGLGLALKQLQLRGQYYYVGSGGGACRKSLLARWSLTKTANMRRCSLLSLGITIC